MEFLLGVTVKRDATKLAGTELVKQHNGGALGVDLAGGGEESTFFADG